MESGQHNRWPGSVLFGFADEGAGVVKDGGGCVCCQDLQRFQEQEDSCIFPDARRVGEKAVSGGDTLFTAAVREREGSERLNAWEWEKLEGPKKPKKLMGIHCAIRLNSDLVVVEGLDGSVSA